MQSTTLEKNNSDTYLCPNHYKALVQDRGLPADWIKANCRSLSADEATQRLGYPAKSDGILLEGQGIQVQYKPDQPWKSQGDKKAAKYRSPFGDYDAMLPNHPDDSTYWTSLKALKAKCYLIDGHPCLVITEGFFKAIAGCANNIPTIALLGVELGLTSSKADIQGKRYLVPTLEKFAQAGFGFIFAFDADCALNSEVLWAQRRLSEQLLKFKVPVYSATGNWTMEQGKGMDDYIQMNSGDKFKRDVLGNAIVYSDWLKIQKLEGQFSEESQGSGNKKKDKIPPADVIGAYILEEYRDRLLWNDEHKTWMQYSLDREGVWSPVSDLYVESAVDGILESKGIIGYNSSHYVSNVVAKMKRKLFTREWRERSLELLPFSDGVYELTTGKFNSHAPSYRLTWCLPRPYSVLAGDWTKISKWLDEATDNNQHSKEVLLSFAAAVLQGRADLQKFLHLIGVGGTGKSTYTRLLEALVGENNCFIGSLQELSDKHVIADLLGKRLAIFPDQDKCVGTLSNFKRLTGQDALNGRRLYKDAMNFRFPGMAVVTSNNPIFHSSGGSWLPRRILMLAFDRKPVADKVRDLEKEFEPELSAFTNYLLSIPNEEITRVLRGLGKGDVQKPLWQAQIRTDSIAAWLNDWGIYEQSTKTLIGSDRNEWNDDYYDAACSTLFGSYSHYCRLSGLQAKGKNNFSAELLELCKQMLGWEVSYCRGSTGQRMIKGLRLRTDSDTQPTLEDWLTTDNSDNSSDNPADNLEASSNKDFDNSDNLIAQNFSSKNDSITISFPPHPATNLSWVEAYDAETEKDLPPEVISPPQSFIEQASQVVSEVVSEVVSKLSDSLLDYSTPHLTSNIIEAKCNQAQTIKRKLLEPDSREELTAIKQGFGDGFHWVWQRLSNAERNKLKALAAVEQLNLLESVSPLVQSPVAEVPVLKAEEVAQTETPEACQANYPIYQVGERVRHPELGEGVVEEQIRDMVFCRFGCGKHSPLAWEVERLE